MIHQKHPEQIHRSQQIVCIMALLHTIGLLFSFYQY